MLVGFRAKPMPTLTDFGLLPHRLSSVQVHRSVYSTKAFDLDFGLDSTWQKREAADGCCSVKSDVHWGFMPELPCGRSSTTLALATIAGQAFVWRIYVTRDNSCVPQSTLGILTRMLCIYTAAEYVAENMELTKSARSRVAAMHIGELA